MKVLSIFAAVLAGFSFTACSRAPQENLQREAVPKSPAEKAEASYKRGEIYVYAAVSVGRYFPGLTMEQGQQIESQFGSRPLLSLSDAIVSREDSEHVSSAIKSATEHNKRILQLLIADGRL